MGFQVVSQGRSTFRLIGGMDLATIDTFRTAMRMPLAGHGDITLNLDGLDFLDSTGVDSIIDVAESLGARHSNLILVGPTGAVSRVLDVVLEDYWPNIAVHGRDG